MSTTAVNAIPEGLTSAEIRTVGIETSLLAVQANRASLLEDLLKDQMETLQKKNEQIAKLNTLMASLNGILTKYTQNANPLDGIPNGMSEDEIKQFNEALAPTEMTTEKLLGFTSVEKSNKSALDKAVTSIKSSIDNLSNTQQMDMLRIQSISNKRNEAFEMMTTFIKKFSDMLSAIIRNMA
ncbi:hypothetical protein [Comamonas endophytica]|uniref:Secreted protein n=1 Tax=Comamonas endophytica TaxID=2949090 RepID=A0ABY6GCL4_9BURK|nr:MULTISPECIES: hypothetical protein [unclassified Acidovorax]MCD2512847.1 hypothetical protein [Acidovorax sp. D4N7]UYG52805.1 hypothetical protein M9799_06075 [Acidovorax sp. 5MLIR]